MYIANEAFVRTIMIPTRGVKTTEFNLSRARARELYQSGVRAGREFFKTWDFEKYKASYRERKAQNRRDTLIAAMSETDG